MNFSNMILYQKVKGKLINSRNLIANFIEHLHKWKPIKKYGLIIIELHTIDQVTRKIAIMMLLMDTLINI